MTFTVSVTTRAQRDLNRLVVWLSVRDIHATARLLPLLEKAFDSLAETPLRGRLVGPTLREINIPFGQNAYVIRYRVSGSHVNVTRIFHSLQHR